MSRSPPHQAPPGGNNIAPGTSNPPPPAHQEQEPLKLKRLLLRYHPPGIGLEVHDGTSAEAEVIHKDLPASEEIENALQIRHLVDEFMSEEIENALQIRHPCFLIPDHINVVGYF